MNSPAAWNPDPLLSVDQLAWWLNTPKNTLYGWRARGYGPPAIRLGTSLRYRRGEVERWLDGHTDQPTTPSNGSADREPVSVCPVPDNDDISPATSVGRLGELWIEDIAQEGRVTAQTINYYQCILRIAIVPALGELPITDMRVGRVDRFLKELAARRPAQARGAKVVLGQMLAMAARHEALASNPVRDTSRLRRPPRCVKALPLDDLNAVRAAIRDWQTPIAGKPGPHHTSDLADIVDLLLGTGARIGEVLALRWYDIDLDASPPGLTISGTLVYLKGKGIFRQPCTKSTAGYRTLTLPRFSVDMLHRRRPHNARPDDPVFSSRRGTWFPPWNVRRQWREARKDTGLEWVTPHTFRKTVATLLDREASTSAAASQLGHANETITTMYYVEKSTIAPDVSDILQMLGTNHATPAAER